MRLNNRQLPLSFKQVSTSVALVALLTCLPHTSRAAPVGGVVASGAAAISASGLVTTINQSTDRAVIDWQSFNLASNETARFVVPSDSSATLNRITGGLSTISGSVESNGVVYFANPNGLVFDATSRVSANGFVATTGTISNFDFMNRGEFSNHNSNQISLNGAISAPVITVQSGTVTVGGNLAAGSGKILLSSTNLTTIGLGAVISADGEANGTGGNIKIWSDNHTDFLGNITALGGASTGDGGFVEVSGKATLNFAGTVSTLAPHGKTGTLLLDPSDITISTGTNSATNSSGTISSTSASSIVNTTTLQTALASSNIIIDANAGSGTGSGLITVANPILAAASGTNSLTLTGSQIVIKANIAMRTGANLTLNATRASVWQDPTTEIVANTLSGSSVDGFSLGGASNVISNIGTITNSGTAGILVRNFKNTTINAGTIDGGKGGVMIVAPNFDVTLGGAVTVKGSYLRLDTGSKNLKGGNTITATGVAVYFTSATSGNAATITVGDRGSFTFVNDRRSLTAAVTLNNSTTAADATNGWGAAPTYGTSGSDYTLGGLTISGTGGAARLQGLGVVYGGTVNIQAVTDSSTTGVNNLRYIEGSGVGLTYLSGSNAWQGASTFSGSLMLVGNGAGINTAIAGGIYGVGILIRANLTTQNGGDLTLVQSGSTTAYGIYTIAATVSAVGAMTLTQSGNSGDFGIRAEGSTLTAGGNLSLIKSGSDTGYGISVDSSTLTAGGDLSLLQTGTLGVLDGIGFEADGTGANQGVTLAAGNSNFVTLKTNNKYLTLASNDNFAVTSGKVRIDLGTSLIYSLSTYTLKATGLDVFYTGATSGNKAKIAVGSGSFTFVNDKRSLTSQVLLYDATTETWTNGWGAAPTYGGVANARTLGGLTITGSIDSAIQGLGVVYGGSVWINGITSGAARNLRYIEGSSLEVFGACTFSGNLSLHQTGTTGSYGIQVIWGALRAGGALTLNQSGSVGSAGIRVWGSSLKAVGDLSLVSSGTVGGSSAGIELEAFNNAANGAVTLSAGTGQFVTLKTFGQRLNLQDVDNFTVTSGKVRIDLGSGALTGGYSLKATGLDVYYSGATTGNDATIAVGSGSFTFVNNRRNVTAAVSLNNSTTASDPTNGWGTAPTYGTSGSDFTLGGLTMSGTGGAARLQGLGVVYGGTVTISGISDSSTTGVNNLRYIEGSGVLVSMGSSFSGSLTLVGNGAGVSSGPFSAAVLIEANLTTQNGGDLSLVQVGSSTKSGITVWNSTMTSGGAMSLASAGGKGESAILAAVSTLTSGGVMSLVSSGNAGTDGINIRDSSLDAGAGAMTLTQLGSAGMAGIYIRDSSLNSVAGAMTLTQSGSAANEGINANNSTLTSGTAMTLIQSGSAGASGIYTDGSTLRAGTAMTLTQSGSAGYYGIFAFNSTLTAGTAMSLTSSGSAENSGIVANSSALTSGTAMTLTQSGNVQKWQGIYILTSSILRSGTAMTLTQSGSAGLQGIYVNGSSLNAVAGAMTLTHSGSSAGGDASIQITSATVTAGTDMTLTQSGSAGLQGIYVSGSSLNAVAGAMTLTHSGSSTGGDPSDASILTSATLTHPGSSAGGDASIHITSSTLTSGAEMSLTSSGTGVRGIFIESSATVTAGGAMTLIQSGRVMFDGMSIYAGLTAGGDLSVLQTGTVATAISGVGGLTLWPAGTNASQAVKFAAGSNSTVTLRSNYRIILVGNDNFAVTGGRLRIDVGTSGTTESWYYNGISWVTPSTHYTLKATGLDVYYTGATTGNSVKISVGGGSFTFVNDKRTVTSLKTLNDSSTATDWGTGLGTLASGTASGGLAVVTTGTAATINNQGVVYGGIVTIDGVGTGSGAAKNLRYIEGNGLGVSGSDSSFTGRLLLRSTGIGLSLGTNLNTSGPLRIHASSLTLSSNVTTAGGAVAIDLGAGTYGSGGFLLTTGNQNLALTAGSVTGAANDGTVFALGTGTLTVTGTVTAVTTAAATKYYDYGWSLANPSAASEIGAVNPNDAAIATWVFYGGKRESAIPGANWNASFTAWMNGGSLAAGKVVKVETTAFYSRAGLDTVNVTGGNVKFKTTSTATTTPTDITLTGRHNINFVSVGSAAAPVTVGTTLSAIVAIFTGANYFSGDLTLNATGSISQTTGAGNTLSISGGKLIVTGSTAITLANDGNNIGSLGALSSTGAITVNAGTAVTLNGNIASGGAIGLTATSMVLGSAVTVSGGDLRITLGSGALTGGQTLTASGRTVRFSGATSGNAATIAVGSGGFSYIYDNRAITTATLIDNSTVFAATYGGQSGNRTIAGLNVTGTNDSALQGLSAVYRGTVTIQGISSGSARNLRYIEGTGIAVLAPSGQTAAAGGSTFSGGLTLVSTGAGVSTIISGTTYSAGILIRANLTTSNGGDLILTQSGSAAGTGIYAGAATVSAAGAMTLTQSGSAGSIGIYTDAATLTAGTAMSLLQSGTASSGIYVVSSNLTSGTSLSVTQTGTSSAEAIVVMNATLSATGGDLSLLQIGTVTNTPHAGTIVLSGSETWNGSGNLRLLAGGSAYRITIQTRSGSDMWLHNADNLTVGNGSLRIDLGSRGMISKYRDAHGLWSSSTPYTLKATGLDVFYTGATSGNNAKIAVGGGTFTFVNDKRTVNGAVSLTNTTTATEAINGWGAAPTYGGSANARTLGGLTITGSNDTAIQGLGVVYGWTVTISGVSSGAASNLRYIEGTGVAVTTASSFSGNLTLVGNGAGITSGGNRAGVLVSANLTTSNGGNLSLHHTGLVNGIGIWVANANLTAGGAMRLNQSSSRAFSGINVVASSLIAGSELSLVQSGTLMVAGPGITLEASGVAVNQAVTLSAGTGQFVTLKTNGNNVTLFNNDNFSVTSGKLRIDLGTSGTIISTYNNGSAWVTPTTHYTLKATGLDVYFSGATTGNNATIAVGSGSFTFVNNRRHVTAAVTLNNSTTASDATNGWGATPVFDILGNDTTLGGLTISGTGGAARLQGLGVVYGGTVTISGISDSSTTGVNNLRYIEGSGVLVSMGSSFSGSLTLVGNGAGVSSGPFSAAVLIEANLTTQNGGDLSLVQVGSSTKSGITVWNSTMTSGGAMSLASAGGKGESAILAAVSTLTSGGVMSLVSSGNAGTDGINIRDSSLDAGAGAMTLTQLGSAGMAGIYIRDSSLNSVAGAMTLTQSGSAANEGINANNSTLTSGTAMTLIQSGSAGTVGILVYGSTTLTAGTTMTLTQSGSSAGGDGSIHITYATLTSGAEMSLTSSGTGVRGIYIKSSSTVTAGGAMTLTQSGTVQLDGMLINASLTAGGDLSLLQTGTIGSTYGGITLQPFGTASGEGVTLAAGSNSFVTLKTNNYRLRLIGSDNFTVTSGRVRIDLGTATAQAEVYNGGWGLASTPFTLTATGLDVFYTGATTGNSAKIAVGSGSFTFVNDKRSVTSAVSLVSTTTATEAINGWGAAPTYGGVANARTLGGLTITGSNDTAIKGLGVVYGGTVTIGRYYGNHWGSLSYLRYIEGRSIATDGAAIFYGVLTLRASGNSGLSLGDDLTTSGGLRLYASTMSLNENFNTTGGAVTINLGAGVYNSGGYILNTNNQNLTLIAGSLTASDNQTVFEVGTGTITVPTGLRATVVLGSTKYWDFDPAASAAGNKGSSEILAGDPNGSAITAWKFYGTGNKGAEATGTAWMNGGSLAAGKVVKVEITDDVSAGLDLVNRPGGIIKFRTLSSTTTTTTAVPFTKATAVTFVSVGTSAAPVTVGTLPNATSVLFSGANYLSGDVTLSSIGNITQTAGAGNTLSITGGKLIVTASTLISLNNTGNSISGLGALSSTGAITVNAGTAVTLNGNIASNGAIGLTATSMVLGSAVTMSGGAVTINLGAGVYNSGGFTFNTSNQNLSATMGSVVATDNQTVFEVGTGTITVPTGLRATVVLGSTKYWDFDPEAAGNKGSSEILAGDPNGSAITAWKFYGTGNKGAEATGTAWMNGGSLAAGKVVKVEITDDVSVAGLDLVNRPGGVIKFRTLSSTTTTPTAVPFTKATAVTFVSVGTSAAPVMVGTLPNATSVLLSGANYLSGDVTLSSIGNITQTAGAGNTLSIAGGRLSVTTSKGISLANDGNSIGSLGALTSTGFIVINTSGALTLNGDIRAARSLTLIAAGAITLSKTGGLTLTTGGDTRITATSMVLGSEVTVNAGVLTIALGSGAITGGLTLWFDGYGVVFSGATSGNDATFVMYNGSFDYLYDYRATTTATVLDNSTLLPAIYGGSPGNRTIAGLTITGSNDSAIQGMSAIYGGTVEIQSISTGSVKYLSYIEGTGIAFTTGASSFNGPLSLVANGNGIDIEGAVAGVWIKSNLSTSNGGDLSVHYQGTTTSNGIVVVNSALTSAGALTLTQSGSAGLDGILINRSSLTAGGNLSLLQTGTVGSGYNGIKLTAPTSAANQAVTLAAGSNSIITLMTSSQKLLLNQSDNFAVTGSRLRIDLGTSGTILSTYNNGSAWVTPSTHYTLKATGLDVFYTGATSGNSAKIAVGGGTFTFVNDMRSVTSAVSLTNTTTATEATNGWGAAPTYGGSANARTLGGLTITGSNDTAIQGLGVVYGGTVSISGVSSGDASNLRYIEGTGVAVTTASSFSGNLTLVGSGAGFTHGYYTAGLGIYANLTTSNGGNLSLHQTGSMNATLGDGILVKNATLNAGGAMTLTQSGYAGADGFSITSSTLTAGTAMTLIQSGYTPGFGIRVYGSTLTAGGDLSLLQTGTAGSTSGINFYSAGTGANQAVTLAAGNSNFVTLKTNNNYLYLGFYDNFAVTSGRVRIDLGTGAIYSLSTFTLKATGLDVYYSGATTGNSAKISVGSGSFTFVNDRRHITSAVSLNNSTTASDATNGYGTAPAFGTSGSDTTLGGLTISGTGGAARLQGLGVAYGGAVTISGVGTGAGAARDLRYIEGDSVTVSGAASSFTGVIQLRSTGSSSLSMGANLTTGGGLRINANGMSLFSNVTTDGGAVSIQLGTTGVYNNGTATSFLLDTSDQDLAITAASIINTSANTKIFKLGSGGVLTLGGGLALAASTITGGATNYGGNYVNTQARYTDFSAAGVKYYFTSDDVEVAETALTTAGITNFYVLPSLAITARRLGTKTLSGQTYSYSSAGLAVRGEGEFYWQASGSTYTDTTGNATDITLQNGHEVHFYNLTAASGTMPSTTPSWLSTSTRIVFDGANSFSSGLTLASAGSITQATGATLSVTGGNLIVSGSTAITLTNAGNALGSLGALSSTGAIAVTTSAGMILNGNISAGGAIGLTATSLTLGSAVTTSGGAVTIALGGGTYTTGGFTLTTTNQNLTLIAASVSGAGNDVTVFALGTGTLTATGLMATVGSSSTKYYDYNGTSDPEIGLVDPTDVSITKWKFYSGTKGTAATDTVWMNAATLAAGKVVKIETTATSSAGFAAKDGAGNVKWKTQVTGAAGTPTEVILTGSRDVTFKDIGSSGTRAAIASTIASSTNKATTISFEGDNYFSGSLSLFSNGAISQTAGKIDLPSGNSLALSGSTISLAGTSNVIGSLGAITATGAIAVTSGVATTLAGDITTTGNSTATIAVTVSGAGLTLNKTGGLSITSGGGAISLTATGLTLGSAVTTSGGNLTINLTTGTYTTGGFTLSTSDQDLTLTAGSVTADDDFTVFALGTGTFATAAALRATVAGNSIKFYDYGWSLANQNSASEILAGDPTANGITKWKFYGSSVTPVTEANTAWMNAASLTAGKVVKVTTNGRVTAGLDVANSTGGNVKYRTESTGNTSSTDITLSGSHDVTFVSVGASGAGGAVAVGALPTANSVVFSGANFLTGNVTLNATGSITQATGATLSVTGGKLSVTDSTEIHLNNSGNSLGSLGALSSSGSIAVKSDGATTLTGDIGSGGSTDLTATGVTIGESITVTGDLFLEVESGGVKQNPSKTLSITDGALLGSSKGAITLDNSGNSIVSLGALSSEGEIRITTKTDLNVTNDLTTGSTITLTATGMYVTSDIRSSGGAVIINLGKGVYNNNGSGYTWSTDDNNVTLNVGTIEAGPGVDPNVLPALFDVGTGKFRTDFVERDGFKKDQIYVKESWSQADKDRVKASYPDSDPEFRTIKDINEGIDLSKFKSTRKSDREGFYYDGAVVFSNSEKSYPGSTSTITFWNVREGSVTVTEDSPRERFNGTIRFDGIQNRFTEFNFATTSTAKLIVGKNSVLNGDLSIGATGLDFEPGATARSGTITAATGQDLRLNFLSDLVQMNGDMKFSAGKEGTLEIFTNGNSVRLMDRGNVFGKLKVTTNGGYFQIVGRNDLTITNLSTAGGWVILDTTGSITATGVTAGAISFRAGGSVVLTGSFVSATGTGSSVVLNNSAVGAVLGRIRSDSSLTIGGSGSTVLVGDITGGSAVTVTTPVVVARDSSVSTNGGRVEFARTVAALNGAGLQLDPGYGGTIALGGNVGTSTQALGWVELTGTVINPSNYGIYYKNPSNKNSFVLDALLLPVSLTVGAVETGVKVAETGVKVAETGVKVVETGVKVVETAVETGVEIVKTVGKVVGTVGNVLMKFNPLSWW